MKCTLRSLALSCITPALVTSLVLATGATVTAAPSTASTSAASPAGELAIVSQEQLDQGINPWQAGDRSVPALHHGNLAPMPADQGWRAVKFTAKDGKGRAIPTRVGNSALGWRHFSSNHNITNPNVVKAIIGGTSNPGRDAKHPHRLVYDGALVRRDGLGFPKKLADIRIIAQYNWETDDGKYDLKNKHDKIGVITAFCRNVARNRCPDKVNNS